jgi:hypothetical protein
MLKHYSTGISREIVLGRENIQIMESESEIGLIGPISALLSVQKLSS